jgi:hypothetical protein
MLSHVQCYNGHLHTGLGCGFSKQSDPKQTNLTSKTGDKDSIHSPYHTGRLETCVVPSEEIKYSRVTDAPQEAPTNKR